MIYFLGNLNCVTQSPRRAAPPIIWRSVLEPDMHFNLIRMLKQAALGLLLTSVLAQAADISKKDGGKWQAPIPTVAENSDDWKALIPALIEHGMPYGALAAARSMP